MLTKKIVVTNPQGLHARPANQFMREAKKYESKVSFRFGGQEFNAKSIITVLRACVVSGSEIELVTDGPDEEAAMAGMAAAIESGLGE